MDIAGLNIDVGTVFNGLGTLAKDIRTAITGKEPIDANRAAELAVKIQELEMGIEKTRLSVMITEAGSADPWTSRARPSFMYVFYLIIVTLVLIAPFVGVFFPLQMQQFYVNTAAGFKAIPEAMWATFTVGYLGYTAARQYGKGKGTDK